MSAVRIVVIGNRGGGKSIVASRLAASHGLPHIEIDRQLTDGPASSAAIDDAEHARLIARDGWVIDGLGRQESIPARLLRATKIVLVDLPLWMHAALAADRFSWPTPLPRTTDANFWQTIEKVERERMPDIRRLCGEAERRGTELIRLESVEALERFAAAL